jgi:hypothetical protein
MSALTVLRCLPTITPIVDLHGSWLSARQEFGSV